MCVCLWREWPIVMRIELGLERSDESWVWGIVLRASAVVPQQGDEAGEEVLESGHLEST